MMVYHHLILNNMNEEQEKGKVIKDALKIVDALSKFEIDDYEDSRKLEELIEKSKKLTKNRFWNLR